MIIERLPASIHEFLKDVESLGFVLTLVGGIPRDFFFADTIGHDFDFEIRASVDVSPSEWAQYYQRFVDHLKKNHFSFKMLPYLITRVDLGDYQLEFSSPRTEKNIDDNFSHHHFKATLDSNLSYENSFKRRDFTINAIGIRLDFKQQKDELVDPYQGFQDLKAGLIKPVSEDFYHDSVRFLRLIRFQVKFNRFIMDAELLKNLKQFNLSKLSQHYFKEEMLKSSPGKFLNLFNRLINEHSLKIPAEYDVFRKYHFSPEIMNREELLGFIYQQDRKDAEKVALFFNLPAKTLKDLESFLNSFSTLSAITENDLNTLVSMETEEALADSFFKDVKNCEDKNIWFELLHLKKEFLLFGPDDWKNGGFSKEEIDSVKPSLRSYFPYLKALKRKLKS